MNDTGRFPELSPYLICVGWSAREAENPYASEHRGKSLQEALSFLDEGPQRGLVSQDRKTLTNNHFIPSNTTLTDSTNKASGEPRLRPCQSASGSSTPLPLLREVGKRLSVPLSLLSSRGGVGALWFQGRRTGLYPDLVLFRSPLPPHWAGAGGGLAETGAFHVHQW